MNNEQYVNHEVRVQLVESYIKDMKDNFKHLETKLDSHFKWMLSALLGILLASLASTVSIVCVLLAKGG
jgi:hypothetical protein